MYILGIETSCDETASSIIQVKNDKIKVLSNIISSQIKIHQKYGGVVPELAAREHIVNILPIIDQSLQIAKINYKKLNYIAIANGPGLITSLLIGVETAKTLAYAWNIPLISINHIVGHIYANFINQKPKLPALILTVSGGHTMLILMKDYNKFKIIGQTRDDASGEAFDKAAKIMNLSYPGGPIVSKIADEFENINLKKTNFIKKINLPRPMINSNDFDFSFSGLKTALFYAWKKDSQKKKNIPEYCFEFQQAIVDVLITKTIKASKKLKIKNIMLTGGVSANLKLRKELEKKCHQEKLNLYIPDLKYTTDNAVMIAVAGYFQKHKTISWKKIIANCSLDKF